jgi:general secretion pathway protein A
MYESHFGFSNSPFQLNPDPAFYFGSRGHSSALAYLKFGAHQGEGFIVVTGEIGAGKTTLVRTLLEGLNPEQVVAAQVVSTQLESGELLQAILMAFGVASSSNSKAHLIGSLEAFLTALAAKGRRALLIIDEAQNLKHEAVEELRMLSNFQLGKYGLLQSFLVGQPELRQLLQSKSMEQLRQRVIASCHLGPLDPPETRAYIEHRLRLVGWSGRPEFMSDAFERIHFWTGGVPRKINRLCNRLLLGAFLSNEDKLSALLVNRIASELKSEIGELSEIPEVQPMSALLDRIDRSTDKSDTTLQPATQNVPADAIEPAAALAENTDTGVAHDTRPKVRLVPGAAVSGAVAAGLRPAVAGSNTNEVAPSGAKHDRVGSESTVSNRVDPRSPLTVVLPLRTVARESELPQPLASSLADDGQPTVTRIQRRTYRTGNLHRPLICLVDSASEFLRAGTLAEVFLKFPALPQIIVVHPGSESSLSFGDTGANELPMPFMGLHLEGLAGSFALQTQQVLKLFEEILIEFDSQAILTMGNSDAVLVCSLLANKRGTPLFRIAGGQRQPDGSVGKDMNGILIDKIADTLYVNRMDSYYTLYQEGIKSDRVLCVGNLVGDMLKYALPHAPSPNKIFSAAGIFNSPLDSTSGFALVDIESATQLCETQAMEGLVSLLCGLAKDLPIVWPAEVEVMDRLKGGYATRLEASNVKVIPSQGYLQRLGLLEKAGCLVGVGECSLLEEACSLRIPTLRVVSDPSKVGFTVVDDPDEGSAGTRQASQILKRLLAKPIALPDSPAYWDLGAATRIANHLGLFLPKIDGASQILP